MNRPSLPRSDSTAGVGIGVGAGVGLGDGEGVIVGDAVAAGAGLREGGTAATGGGVAACRAIDAVIATATTSATNAPADNASLGRRRTDCQAPLGSVMAGRYHPTLHQTPRTMVPLVPGSRARAPTHGKPAVTPNVPEAAGSSGSRWPLRRRWPDGGDGAGEGPSPTESAWTASLEPGTSAGSA